MTIPSRMNTMSSSDAGSSLARTVTIEALLTEGQVSMEGWLYKKGAGSRFIGRRNWRRRYFVLISSRDGIEPSALFYFDQPPSYLPDEDLESDVVAETLPTPRGAILLDAAEVRGERARARERGREG